MRVCVCMQKHVCVCVCASGCRGYNRATGLDINTFQHDSIFSPLPLSGTHSIGVDKRQNVPTNLPTSRDSAMESSILQLCLKSLASGARHSIKIILLSIIHHRVPPWSPRASRRGELASDWGSCHLRYGAPTPAPMVSKSTEHQL